MDERTVDTPEQTLNRMVDSILSGNEIAVAEEVQYFWRQGWKLGAINDPREGDPLRYALKACLVERLHEIWTTPPKNRTDNIPAWCETVGPVETPFSIVKEADKYLFENFTSDIFAKRNIYAPKEYLFFV